MHIIYLEKNILLENIINEINLINIDEDIEYLNRNDGILIKGTINIEGEYISLGVLKKFYDYLNVSILIPYENIITKFTLKSQLYKNIFLLPIYILLFF